MSTAPHNPSQSGYNLVEISIVLVIVGLLIGGVMVGRSLIRQSEVTSVMQEAQQYQQIVQQFEQQYASLPGDFSGASRLWATAVDGDGNGQIENMLSNATTNGAGNEESAKFWSHLYLANYMANKGIFPANGSELGATTTVESALNGARWVISGCPVPADSRYNMLGLHTLDMAQPVLTAGEAITILTKYDDGLFSTGAIRAYNKAAAGSCAGQFPAGDCTASTLDNASCDLFISIQPLQQ